MANPEFVQALRDAADFFEARPELNAPTNELKFLYYGAAIGDISIDSIEGLAGFTRAIGGRIDKTADSDYFRLRADRGTFSVSAIAYRDQVCERVQVGTKVEPGHVVPAQAEQYIAAREVPVYEYRCPSILNHSREDEAPAEQEAVHAESE